MKKYLSIIVGLMMVFGVSPVFAANDLTISVSTPILVGGYTLLIYGGDKVIDSLTVSDSDFSVTLSPSASFSVSSSDRKNFSIGGANGIIADIQCTDSLSSVTVSALSTNVGSDSITVTPLSTTCVSYSGGGGGGGSVYVPPVTEVVATTTPVVTTLVITPVQLPAQASSVAGVATTVAAIRHTFNTALKLGSKGTDVTELQKILVAEGYLTMPSGIAYGTFGTLTQSAVKKYQAANGIDQLGNVGPATRAKLNASVVSSATQMSSAQIQVLQIQLQSLQAQLLILLGQQLELLKAKQ